MERYTKLVNFGLITFVSHVSVVVAQSSDDCDKYCFASCSDYFHGPEFSPCVTANVNCSCTSKFTIRNPLMIFLLIASILITLFCCGVCYGMKRTRCSSRSNTQRIIAQPVVASPVMSNPIVYSSNGHATNANISHHQPNAPGCAYPMAYPNPSNVPTEYLEPPPAYNNCVVDMDSTKQIGKF